jgi:probable addiction module antidote protein
MTATRFSLDVSPLTEAYEDYMSDLMQDGAEAEAYLTACFESEDHRTFLLALRDIAEARGMSKIASASGLNRENLYRILSELGNPRLSSLKDLLRALGVKVRFMMEEGSAFEQCLQEIDAEYPELISSFSISSEDSVYGDLTTA